MSHVHHALFVTMLICHSGELFMHRVLLSHSIVVFVHHTHSAARSDMSQGPICRRVRVRVWILWDTYRTLCL